MKNLFWATTLIGVVLILDFGLINMRDLVTNNYDYPTTYNRNKTYQRYEKGSICPGMFVSDTEGALIKDVSISMNAQGAH